MIFAFIGRYLPKMLGRPLYKGFEAREVCFRHLPYTSHRPPVIPPVTMEKLGLLRLDGKKLVWIKKGGVTGGLREVYGRFSNNTSRLGTPLNKGIPKENGRYRLFFAINRKTKILSEMFGTIIIELVRLGSHSELFK